MYELKILLFTCQFELTTCIHLYSKLAYTKLVIYNFLKIYYKSKTLNQTLNRN